MSEPAAPVRTPKEWGELFAGCFRERIADDSFTTRLAFSVEGIVTQALAAERKACAEIVLAGGDGKPRLETAIRHGPNAALAEAILERGAS